MKCFVCDKDLETDDLVSSTWMPVYNGLEFRAAGNYGSTIYDPVRGGEILKIVICDDCVKAKKDQLLRLKVTPQKDKVEQIPADF